jgi:hypothetical protein
MRTSVYTILLTLPNIWDFGGQEIYQATHQFFLTRRSVYVLVCDDRKEDTDFSYWLQVVEMLSDASPLVIVQNERQDRTRDINPGSLRARFANLRAVVETNLDTNRGLDGVIQSIRKELESLPHVGVGLPATWKRVREALEQDKRDYVGLDEYLAICQQHGFTRREDKLQLSGYLHDLGICLHFQDDPLLKNTVVLNLPGEPMPFTGFWMTPRWSRRAVVSDGRTWRVSGRRRSMPACRGYPGLSYWWLPAVRTRGDGRRRQHAPRIAPTYSSQPARRSRQPVQPNRCSSRGADAAGDSRPRL